ncbi:MAG: response regulator [Verrucomicrobia bacterium]|nr:response regulator [Verrucomicrobiota bacterium]
MNHELRTPLNPIIAGSELLSDSNLAEGDRSLVTMIHTAGKSLLQIINSLLTLSNLDQGQVVVNSQPFSPSELLKGLQSLYEATLNAKGISFEIRIENPLPDYFKGDVLLIRQVVLHLLSNAEKFTFSGSVRLVSRYDVSKSVWSLTVEDTGVGIAAEMIQDLFNDFHQLESGNTRRFGGVGIGLSICKKICNILGASIHVTSEQGRGSKFQFNMPVETLNLESSNSKTEHSRKSVDQLAVLVVDDDRINRRILVQVLRDKVCLVESAVDGIDAIQKIREQDFDVVLMDIHMPHMNGFEAARAIILEKQSAAPAIFFVSADNRPEAREKAAEIQAAGFMSKPVDTAYLLSALQKNCQPILMPIQGECVTFSSSVRSLPAWFDSIRAG